MKFLYKKLTILKITITFIVFFVIILFNFIDWQYFHADPYGFYYDTAFSLIISFIIVFMIFTLIKRKNQQQKNQLDQLVDAYKYIGQINRKIDTLLELDISSLDQSKNHTFKQKLRSIFKPLITILEAEAGYLLLKPPLNHVLAINLEKNTDLLLETEKLAKKEITEFKFNQGKENELFFKNHGVDQKIIEKYLIVTKPVYMHQQNIGLMILYFKKNHILEDRDINIIRIFSFYIALNITFKPDFSKLKS